MSSITLREARKYEEIRGGSVPAELRPVFHLSPRIGWMNDPNGFSEYGGRFHQFYQYHPYSRKWGPMHWGHAVSEDLVTWEYLPAALAPDTSPDRDGCWSGSALTADDGRHILMYTGLHVLSKDTGAAVQKQCVAFGDGTEYTKYEGNPVLDEKDLPEGFSIRDFRDPKMFREKDGTYGCVLASCTKERDARILYYTSEDGITWKFAGILAENNGRFGTFWECPDFFELDGKAVLLCSPMHMLKTDRYSSGNGNLCLIGSFDRETCRFKDEYDQPVDFGLEFYASQTMMSSDGRRIMAAWMQNWDTVINDFTKLPWYGQMILPRELSVKNGKLYQQPVREIEKYRTDRTVHENVVINGSRTLEGVSGRTADLQVTIRPAEENSFRTFEIRLAENEEFFTSLKYDRETSELTFDRSFSGTRKGIQHTRSFKVREHDGELKLRILLDRWSVECFVNDGEQAATSVLYTDLSAEGISFHADGNAYLSIEKHTLSI